MADHLVEHVSDPRPWKTGQGHDMVGYILRLKGVEKPVHLNQKPETAAPTAGQSMALEIGPHKYFDDALMGKKPQQAGGFGGGRPRDPKELAGIVRQHSQEMALMALRLAIDVGAINAPGDGADFFKKLESTTTWFVNDVERAKAAA